jgi:hypothetical protein
MALRQQESGRRMLAICDSAPAPTLADDVAALREHLEKTIELGTDAEAMFDRIAARAPQRATAPDGRPMWQHACGQGAYGLQPPPWCPSCRDRPTVSQWRALYVMPDGA